MTERSPDQLVNEHPSFRLHGLHVYGLYKESASGFGEFEAFRSDEESDWHEGRVFHLSADGRLKVVSQSDASVSFGDPTDQGNEFFLCLRPFFSGPSTFVLFRSGRLVEDESEWVREDQVITGYVRSVFRDAGILIDVGAPAFLPRSYLPEDVANDLASLVGQEIQCVFNGDVSTDRQIVVKPVQRIKGTME